MYSEKSNLSYSLEGEDLIASSILGSNCQKLYFDIGCSSPLLYSNTYTFYQRGWRGLAVDPRDLEADWKQHRARDKFVRSAIGSKDTSITYSQFNDPHLNTCDAETAKRYSNKLDIHVLDTTILSCQPAYDMWRAYEKTQAPDLVSIDVEGFELPVLESFNLNLMRPKLFIVEMKLFNFQHPEKNNIFNFMAKNAYSLIAKTPLDGFFIDSKSDHFKRFPRQMLFDC